MSDFVDPNVASLRKYIDESMAAGMSLEQIKVSLLAAGWSAEQVGAAFGEPVTPNIGLRNPESFHQQVPDENWDKLDKPRGKGLRGLLLGLLLLLVFGGGGVFAVYKVAGESKWPLYRALENTMKLESVSYKVQVKSETKVESEENGVDNWEEVLIFEGEGVSGWGEDDLASESLFSMSAKRSNPDFYTLLETKSINDVLYVRLNDGVKQELGIESEAEWVKVDRNFRGLEQTRDEDAGEADELSTQQRQEIKNALVSSPIVKVSENKGLELSENIPVVRYGLVDNWGNVDPLIDALVDVDDSFEGWRDLVKGLSENWKLNGEVVVGLVDGKVYELKLESINKEMGYRMVAEASFSRHGNKFEITEPKEYVTYEDLLNQRLEMMQRQLNQELEFGGDEVEGAIVDMGDQVEDQYAAARDAKRKQDLYTITNAIYQYAAEHNGELPEGIKEQQQELGTGVGSLDISRDLVPAYLTEMFVDPVKGTAETSGYLLYLDANGRVVAEAGSELKPEEPIKIIR